MNKGLQKIKDRHEKALQDYINNPNKCLNCNEGILPKSTKLNEVLVKKFCNHSCSAAFNNKSRKKEKIVKEVQKKELVLNYTKEDLKNKYKDNWWKARIPIARKARKIYNSSDKPKQCMMCGYNLHYEVCHIKPVSDFEETTTVKEINDLDNLIAFCRNCHWEYDNGLLII